MPKFAKIDYHLPEVSEVATLAEGEAPAQGFVPCPEEVEPGWTYSAGHWGSPPEPEAEPEATAAKPAKPAYSFSADDDNHKKSKKER